MTVKKSVYYTIWCDDGRACNTGPDAVIAGQTFYGVTKAEAVAAAKASGWWVDPRYRAQCPACCQLVVPRGRKRDERLRQRGLSRS